MPEKQPNERKQRRYDPLEVLAYIANYEKENPRRSPSERRIRKDLGISSPSVAHMILARLERAGLLTITRYGPGYASDIFVTDAGRVAVQVWQEGQDTNKNTSAEQE